MESAAREVREAVFIAVRDTLGDSILLSGGLDTGIVLAAATESQRTEPGDLRTYTVVLQGVPAPDLEFSRAVSKHFRVPLVTHAMSLAELEGCLPEVVKVLRTFDPMEVRNSVAVYVGMKRARLDGRAKIMTGDASDELFAGYSFVFNLPKEKARESLFHLWEVMHFSSIPLAASLGMEARLPFLHPKVREVAESLDFSLLNGKRPGSGELTGKYVLRKAFEDILPPEIVWRPKTPIENGSGTTALPRIYSEMTSDAEFTQKREEYLGKDGVRLRDKEQLRYYRIYRELFGPPGPVDPSQRACPACTSNVPRGATFCTTCGEYPI